jgi:RHS repeat-associated protein
MITTQDSLNNHFYLTDHLGSVRVKYQSTFLPGACSNINIVEATDYTPYGKVLRQYQAGSGYKYGYQGSEKDDALGLNKYYTHFRGLDADIGRWKQMDPVFHHNESPYVSMKNNPILFNDIFGDEVDPSKLYEKDKKTGEYKHKDLVSAFETFAKTKKGQEFLAQFASKGQVIAGITYNKDGKFHSKGIDLAFNKKNLNGIGYFIYRGPNGNTEKPELKNGRWSIKINVNSVLNTDNNSEASDYEDNSKNENVRNLFLASRAGTMAHEGFIHSQLFAEDIMDNSRFDYSNIDSDIKKKHPQTSYHHYQVRKPNSYFIKNGLKANMEINGALKTGKTENQIWDSMWHFEH